MDSRYREAEATVTEDALRMLAKLEAGEDLPAVEGPRSVDTLSKEQIEKVMAMPRRPAMPRAVPEDVLHAIKEDDPELAEDRRGAEADLIAEMTLACEELFCIREEFVRGGYDGKDVKIVDGHWIVVEP